MKTKKIRNWDLKYLKSKISKLKNQKEITGGTDYGDDGNTRLTNTYSALCKPEQGKTADM